MTSAGSRTVAALGTSLALLLVTRGDEAPVPGESPYKLIAERNAFGIKPVEPAPPPPPPVAPPAQPSNVFLTGITDLGDGRQAYLSINRPGAKFPEFLALKEGEIQGDIQVIAIDMRLETVRLRNAGNELSLNFKDNSLKSTLPAPGVPPPPGGVPGVPTPTPGFPSPVQQPGRPGVAGTPNVGGPVVVGRRGEIQQPNAPTTFAGGGVPQADYAQPVNYNAGTAAPLRELPTRRTRVDVGAPAANEPAQGSVPEGIKVVPPPTFRPPLPGQPQQ